MLIFLYEAQEIIGSSKNRRLWDLLLNFSLSCLFSFPTFSSNHGQFYLLYTLTLVFFYFLASTSCLLKTHCFQSKGNHKTKVFWFEDDVLQTLGCYIFVSLSIPMRLLGTKRLLTKEKQCLK